MHNRRIKVERTVERGSGVIYSLQIERKWQKDGEERRRTVE